MILGKQLQQLKLSLDECNAYAGKNFVRTIYKLRELVKEEVNVIESCLRGHADGDLIEKEREILFKYADKDENGNIQFINGSAKVSDVSALNQELIELHEKYSEFWDTYKELLDAEVSFKVPTLDEDDIPENIKGVHYAMLKDIGVV